MHRWESLLYHMPVHAYQQGVGKKRKPIHATHTCVYIHNKNILKNLNSPTTNAIECNAKGRVQNGDGQERDTRGNYLTPSVIVRKASFNRRITSILKYDL